MLVGSPDLNLKACAKIFSSSWAFFHALFTGKKEKFTDENNDILLYKINRMICFHLHNLQHCKYKIKKKSLDLCEKLLNIHDENIHFELLDFQYIGEF